MWITRLGLRDFRNYKHRDFTFGEGLTIFVGANATGKTTIAEAIQTIATGESFRKPKWDETIRWGCREALVTMEAEGETAAVSVELHITADGRRGWKVDGVTRKQTRSATRFVPVVVFTPDDLTLVKGPAEQRRSAIDALGDQLSSGYATLRRDYARVVRQRNALLRDDAPDSHLTPWDEHLVHLGARLHLHRRRLLVRVAEAAAPVYAHISAGESLAIVIDDRCGIGLQDPTRAPSQEELETSLQAELRHRASDERARRTSLVGPHRDDIGFTLDGRDARTFASQGQQRTIALAWKWAEVNVVAGMLGKSPVLILDDVMSELDESRRRALTDLVRREGQTFITTTNTGYFEPGLLESADVVTTGGDA